VKLRRHNLACVRPVQTWKSAAYTGVHTKGGRNGSLKAGFLRAKEAFPPRRNKLQIVEKMDEEYRMSRAPATK
jgi:hypothetical protein